MVSFVSVEPTLKVWALEVERTVAGNQNDSRENLKISGQGVWGGLEFFFRPYYTRGGLSVGRVIFRARSCRFHSQENKKKSQKKTAKCKDRLQTKSE